MNEAMRHGLRLAIREKMRFERDEIKRIYEHFRGDAWFFDGEWILRDACFVGNTSAAVSFAAWRGRSPFLWRDRIDPPHGYNAEVGRSPLKRLYVGARFIWEGEAHHVTSFPDGQTLIACTYHQVQAPSLYGTGTRLVDGKVKSRRRITAAEIRTVDKARAKVKEDP